MEEEAEKGNVVNALYTHPPQAQQPGKALTDEEIERNRNEYFLKCDDSIAPTNRANGFADGLRYARDNGYLAPSAVVWCGCGDEIKSDTDAICGNCAAKPTAAGLTVEDAEIVADVLKQAHEALLVCSIDHDNYTHGKMRSDAIGLCKHWNARLTAVNAKK